MDINLEELLSEFNNNVKFDYDLKKKNWFNIGGKTKIFYKADNLKELIKFLKKIENKDKIFVLSGGSNTLITDKTYDGVVIKLSNNFNNMSLLSNDIIIAGSAVGDKSLSEYAMNNSLGGFEFLSCIPGTVGGGIKMNAGCFGKEFKDILISIQAINKSGQVITISAKEIDACLMNADSIAVDKSVSLENLYPEVAAKIEFLSDEKSCASRTYLAVFAVGVVARALRSSQDLDVLAIKAAEIKGYSATSIAPSLAAFAKQQNIDLRTRSTNVMNSQPFCYESRILPTIEEMGGRLSWSDSYSELYEALLEIQALESSQAQEVLALLFRMNRLEDHGISRIYLTGGRKIWTQLVRCVQDFVDENIEGGRVGQAFVAAALSVAWPDQEVSTKLVNDPSFSSPGDVEASSEGTLWLSAEARQKHQKMEDVTGFAIEAKDRGVDRVHFAALRNHLYPSDRVNREEIRKIEEDLNLSLTLLF